MSDEDLKGRILYLLKELIKCITILFISNDEKENFIDELLKEGNE